jgi:hypothetical protein
MNQALTQVNILLVKNQRGDDLRLPAG